MMSRLKLVRTPLPLSPFTLPLPQSVEYHLSLDAGEHVMGAYAFFLVFLVPPPFGPFAHMLPVSSLLLNTNLMGRMIMHCLMA